MAQCFELTVGDTPKLSEPDVDWDRLRAYRLQRLRSAMASRRIDVALITNPLAMRYAVDYWNYPLFLSRIPSTILLVPLEGPIAISGAFLPKVAGVDLQLPMFCLSPFDAGLDQTDRARAFARTLQCQLNEWGMTPSNCRIGVDRLDPSALQALMQTGMACCDVNGAIEEAKAIKSVQEVTLIRYAINVAQLGISRMREVLIPGITERQLWSIFHQTNIAYGGFWTEGNMLASGARTNPWLQEASDKVIQAGDLVAFDTDMVGPYCYFADISRTWHCGDGRPSGEQKDLYQRAYDEVYSNLELVRPGVTFKEFSEHAFAQREIYHQLRYPCVVHGVGMSDEYPKIAHKKDWESSGYDGIIDASMVLCVESYVGKPGRKQGVKLEEQVLVTEHGYEKLSSYPIGLEVMS